MKALQPLIIKPHDGSQYYNDYYNIGTKVILE